MINMVGDKINHEHNFQDVCEEERCGLCYEVDLLSTRDIAPKLPDMELRYDQDKHIMRMMKAKSGTRSSG